jgi:hypothetical protein
LLKALPLGSLLNEFVNSIASELLTVAFTVAGAVLSRRIKRLDHFIAAHLRPLAGTISVLLAASLWLNAGMPMNVPAVVSAVIVAAVGFLLLAFSGRTLTSAMHEYTEDQAGDAGEMREQEAKAIVDEAVFSGEPGMATAIFGLDVAGTLGEGLLAGCLTILLGLALGMLVLLAAALAAHFLYGLAWLWAILTGVIVLGAGAGVLGIAHRVGAAHAGRVPLSEKYKPIISRDDG